MLVVVCFFIYFIIDEFNWSFLEFLNFEEFKSYNKIFIIEDFFVKSYFLKFFFGGMFIIICMIGLD